MCKIECVLERGRGTWLSNVSLKTVNCVVMHLKFD